jgi:nucleotide-binding universal stress UspA family protein
MGLFVEDVDLFNLAGLPFGREVQTLGGARDLDETTLEAELTRRAAQVKRSLDLMAQQAQVTSSFRVVRGRVSAEVILAAGDGDLLVLGTSGRSSRALRIRPGSTAIAAAEKSPRSVLIVRSKATIAGNVLVAYNESTGSDLALEAATRFLDDSNITLTIAIIAETEEKLNVLQRRIEMRMSRQAKMPRILKAKKLDLQEVCQLSQQTGADILVIGADSPVLYGKAHARLLEEAGCPVLLVR